MSDPWSGSDDDDDWHHVIKLLVELSKKANGKSGSVTFSGCEGNIYQGWDIRIAVAQPGYWKDDDD